MTLSLVIKGSEGLVLASDTRLKLHADGPKVPFPLLVNYDGVTKLLTGVHNRGGPPLKVMQHGTRQVLKRIHRDRELVLRVRIMAL